MESIAQNNEKFFEKDFYIIYATMWYGNALYKILMTAVIEH